MSMPSSNSRSDSNQETNECLTFKDVTPIYNVLDLSQSLWTMSQRRDDTLTTEQYLHQPINGTGQTFSRQVKEKNLIGSESNTKNDSCPTSQNECGNSPKKLQQTSVPRKTTKLVQCSICCQPASSHYSSLENQESEKQHGHTESCPDHAFLLSISTVYDYSEKTTISQSYSMTANSNICQGQHNLTCAVTNGTCKFTYDTVLPTYHDIFPGCSYATRDTNHS